MPRPSPIREVPAGTPDADANGSTLDEAQALVAVLQATGKHPKGAITQLLLAVAIVLNDSSKSPEQTEGLIDQLPDVMREMLAAVVIDEACAGTGTAH